MPSHRPGPGANRLLKHSVSPALPTPSLVSFGIDGIGEIHLVSIGGTVWRLTAGRIRSTGW
jgi:hypothetical protein